MSHQIMRIVNDTKETDSMQTYQSVWMSRWNRTRCNSTTQAHNSSSNTVRKKGLDHTMGDDNCANTLKISRPVKRDEEIVTKTLETVKESPRMSSKSLRKEGMVYQNLPMVLPTNCGSGFLFKLGQDTDDVEISGCASGYNSDHVKAVTCETEIQFPGILAANDICVEKCNYQDESTSKNRPKWTRSHSSAKESMSVVSKCLWESCVKPSSVASPFIFERQHSEFDEGKTSVPSFIGRSAIFSCSQLIDANLRPGKHEYQHNHEVDSHLQPRNSVAMSFRESNASSLFDHPSMSSHHMSTLSREWFQEMQKSSGLGLFPSQSNAAEKTEVMKSLYDCYSQQKLSKCTYDMETMRIYSTVDFVVDTGVGCPRFCQETHSLLITNLEDSLFKSTRISGDSPCDFCDMSPFYGQGKRGMKIQSPSNFNNSERKRKYVKDSEVTAKNGSSLVEKDPLSGAISTASKKVIYMDCNSPRQASVASSIQGEFKRSNTELHDINLELSLLPSTVTSSKNEDPLSSGTQSLKMDILLTHTKKPKQQSIPCIDNSPVANPGKRCVKRRKLSSSHSTAQGSRSSSKDEPSFQGELNKNCGTIAVICSEPTLTKDQGKDQYFSMNPQEKDQKLLLSHAWIKRWQCNRSSSTKKDSSTVVFCDPGSSNLTLKGLQNEQFPSIAAMALMGRAISGFQPCELQKRGSLTVWYSRDL